MPEYDPVASMKVFPYLCRFNLTLARWEGRYSLNLRYGNKVKFDPILPEYSQNFSSGKFASREGKALKVSGYPSN